MITVYLCHQTKTIADKHTQSKYQQAQLTKMADAMNNLRILKIVKTSLFKTTLQDEDLTQVMGILKSALNLSECYAQNLDKVQKKIKKKPTAHNIFIGALMKDRRRNMKEANIVYKKVMQHRMKYATMKIQRAWRERIADPVYQICRNRLMYEFSSENLSGFPNLSLV